MGKYEKGVKIFAMLCGPKNLIAEIVKELIGYESLIEERRGIYELKVFMKKKGKVFVPIRILEKYKPQIGMMAIDKKAVVVERETYKVTSFAKNSLLLQVVDKKEGKIHEFPIAFKKEKNGEISAEVGRSSIATHSLRSRHQPKMVPSINQLKSKL